jgi:hypothetical protein
MLSMMTIAAGARAHASSVETLVMPGKVVRAHAKWEAQCSSCHDRTNVRTQSALCLDCHKEIAADIGTRHGYHGRMPNAGTGECRACHTDHKGRDADIVQLGRARFDHKLTEFPLEGAHRTLGCDSCHKAAETWNKAPTDCVACHRGDDVHRGQFKQSCGECHSSMSWSGGHFDHGQTAFRLTGAHLTVACNACHIGGRYASTPQTCVGCHAVDDEHRGSRGPDCGKCHNTNQWKSAQYDHFKETGYALLGAHGRLDCLTCHRGGNYQVQLPKDCFGCHRADDTHAGRFGRQCADCHDNDEWKPSATYDHLGRHHFALVGAHSRISCDACHTAPTATQKLGTTCDACHASEDPHGGQLKQSCDTCHNQDSWRTGIIFDHDLSKFPLIGLHRLVSCAQCHSSLDFVHEATECVGCHSADDVHKGALGRQCESCHSPNGWALWRFDHAKQTDFALTGAHAQLQCADCHREQPGRGKTSPLCVSCHRQDDRHQGAYGSQCERCHSTVSWKGARVQ